MWEDALRVAKKASGEKAAQQVKIYTAYMLSFSLFVNIESRSSFLFRLL